MAQMYQQYPQGGQYGQSGYQAQTPMGQRLQSTQSGQFVGQRFSESVPQEVIQVVSDLDRLATVAEWAHTRATERGMHRLARVCDDLAEIAILEKKLVIRQSPFAQPIGHATRQVIQNAAQELQQFVNQPEVQETLSEAQQTVSTLNNVINRLQSVGGGGSLGGQYGQGGLGGQFGQGGPGGQFGQGGPGGQYGQMWP